MNWRDKFANFMYGRYGVDELSKFMLLVTFILCIVSMFVRTSIISLLILLLIVLTYFRMFSRNCSKRYQENLKFLKFKNKIGAKLDSQKWIMKQRQTHHIYRCPTCGQKIRIPKGKGRICITCPKCKTEFTKTS